LVSRETSGALIVDLQLAAAQAAALAHGQAIDTLNGGRIRVQADTICLHSDTPDALNIARASMPRSITDNRAPRFLQPDHALLTFDRLELAYGHHPLLDGASLWSMRASASA